MVCIVLVSTKIILHVQRNGPNPRNKVDFGALIYK